MDKSNFFKLFSNSLEFDGIKILISYRNNEIKTTKMLPT